MIGTHAPRRPRDDDAGDEPVAAPSAPVAAIGAAGGRWRAMGRRERKAGGYRVGVPEGGWKKGVVV